MKRVLGYSDVWSVAPGAKIRFKVSTYGPERYRADLVRVISGEDEPERGVFREEEIDAPFNGEHPGRLQPIDAGSYAVVPASTVLDTLESFTVQCWVFATTPNKGVQGLISQWRDDPRTGFALLIDDTGSIAMRVGDGIGGFTEISTGTPLAERRWYLVSGSYDAATREVSVSQEPVASTLEGLRAASARGAASGFAGAKIPLMFAAFPAIQPSGKPGTKCHFNGKIDRPRLSASVLSAAEISAAAARETPHDQNPQIVAAWDFSRRIGTDAILDVGPHSLHGRTVNLPSRGCKGHNWSGTEQSWRHAPQEYGAIHFHDDDLYDADWETDFEYVVPTDLRSGVYAARLRVDGDESYVNFFVRPPRGTTTARLAFLASTVTYMAYANIQWNFHERYAEATETFWTTMEKADVFLQEHKEFGLSTYDTHSDGSGVRFASRLQPVLSLVPATHCWSLKADTHILGWLESQGIEFDVITDEDLHREGAGVLEPYSAVLTSAHPEYYTTAMLEGLRSYIAGSGRLIYLKNFPAPSRCAEPKTASGIATRSPENTIWSSAASTAGCGGVWVCRPRPWSAWEPSP